MSLLCFSGISLFTRLHNTQLHMLDAVACCRAVQPELHVNQFGFGSSVQVPVQIVSALVVLLDLATRAAVAVVSRSCSQHVWTLFVCRPAMHNACTN